MDWGRLFDEIVRAAGNSDVGRDMRANDPGFNAFVSRSEKRAFRKYMEAQRARENKYKENTNNENDNTNKGGCFITTAVCDSFNKPDNCYELTMFRDFRDNWLMKEADGKTLVNEYYEIAPRIVERINLSENAKDVYLDIWTDYLKPCLSDLESGDNVSCKNRYTQMVTDLKRKYLI